MKVKTSKHIWITLFLVSIPLIIFIWIKQSGNFDVFYAWSQQNLVLFVVVLFLLKVLAMIYPPLPGGILTLGAIPVIGWFEAYMVDLAGSMVGSSIAFVLGKKYGYRFLHKVFDEETVKRFHAIKIKPGREIESVFVLRTLGGMIVEVIAYGSGLLGIGYFNFLIGSTLSHVVVGIPAYYLASNIFSTQNIVISVVLAVLSVTVLWRVKGRYFE